MTRQYTLHFWPFLMVFVLLIPVSAGCGKKKERTRDEDRTVIKKMLVEIGKLTAERKPDDFDKYIILSFDARAFVDTVWAELDADSVSFRTIQTKIWPDEARSVIEISYSRDGAPVGKRYYGFDLICRDENWKFTAFNPAGASL